MADSALIPLTRMDTSQVRLNAAIAAFRSEVSASGYVVEEVRLRLPVPNFDVMPRVVIAQKSASHDDTALFTQANSHRPLSSYTPPVPVPCNKLSKIASTGSFANASISSFEDEKDFSTELKKESASGVRLNGGHKRTLSGSVIFHSASARAASSLRENTKNRILSRIGIPNMDSLGPMHHQSSKERQSLPGPTTKTKSNGQFWKTVIGNDLGKEAGDPQENTCCLKDPSAKEKASTEVAMDIIKLPEEVCEDNNRQRKRQAAKRSPGVESRQANARIERENTHHINGHDIPESHVQLLLSSAADNSARECNTPMIERNDNSPNARSTGDEKKSSSRAMVVGKPNRKMTTSVSNSKQNLRTRREGSERRATGSSAARPYKCTICPSSFDREGHLRVHILAVHEKKRPFVCQLCEASFGHSSSLLRHVRTVHQASPAVGSGKTGSASCNTPNSNELNSISDLDEELYEDGGKHFRCSACRKAFNRVAHLNRHVAKKHPLRTSSVNNCPWKGSR